MMINIKNCISALNSIDLHRKKSIVWWIKTHVFRLGENKECNGKREEEEVAGIDRHREK